MPSAPAKPEKGAAIEVEDPLKQAISVFDKKKKCLEKRRSKLDTYRKQENEGINLTHDQKLAVSKYDSVVASLEVLNELQTQLSEIAEKTEKAERKRKREQQHLQRVEDFHKFQQYLELQQMLDSMGDGDVREDFLNGQNAAPVLTDKQLILLDELYKLINPDRDDPNSAKYTPREVSEHVVNFLHGRNKAVLETTYKDLKDLVERINVSGYFKKHAEAVAAAAAANKVEPVIAEAQPAEELQTEPQVAAAPTVEEPAPEVVPPEPIEPVKAVKSTPAVQDNKQADEPIKLQSHVPQVVSHASHSSAVFCTSDIPPCRALSEVLRNIQGNFDFLQESQLEIEQDSVFEAAVAAVTAQNSKPVTAPPAAQYSEKVNAKESVHQTFEKAPQTAPGTFESAEPTNQKQSAVVQPQTASKSMTNLPAPGQYAPKTSASYTQKNAFDTIEHHQWDADEWDNSQADVNWAEAAPSWANKQWGVEENHPDGPAPIPMPQQAYGRMDNAQSYSQATLNDKKKKSFLNPNANIFNSVYPSQGGNADQDPNYGGSDSFGGEFTRVDPRRGRGGKRYNNRYDSRNHDSRGDTNGYQRGPRNSYERDDHSGGRGNNRRNKGQGGSFTFTNKAMVSNHQGGGSHMQ